MSGEGASGLHSVVGGISMESVGVEEDEVSGVEDHAAGLLPGHDGDGTHFGGEIDEGNPGGEHFLCSAGEPAAFFTVPMVFDFSGSTRFIVYKLIVPETDLLEWEGFPDEFGEAAVAQEACELGAEEGGVGVFASTGFAGAGVGPLEFGGAVGQALIEGVLAGTGV